jgi:hypothetical protein
MSGGKEVNLILKSGSTFSLFLYLLFKKTKVEKLVSHLYVVTNGIRNLTAFSDNCEYSFRQLSQKLVKESLSKYSFKAVSQESSINESISDSFNCNIS